MTEIVELTAELLVDGAEPVDPVISPDGRLVAYVISTDEPDPEDERRKADGDDALVWGQDVPCNRLLLLDPAAGDLKPPEPHAWSA